MQETVPREARCFFRTTRSCFAQRSQNRSVTVVNKEKAVAVSGKPAALSPEKLWLVGRVLILCSYIATL